ncbi:hypothetical protein M5689_025040 [Euphorbia peplus]|nr:hypothetical protein M5689_025040 [Euphorbia peplus]
MGCGGSKVDDLPLVVRCRERKELIKAASDHRYALAAAHVLYFHSLRDVGEAIRKFVDEELVIASSPGSPVLTLPSREGKSKGKPRNSSTSTSISHSADSSGHNHKKGRHKGVEEDIEDSHLHLSSGSDLDSDSGHIHIHDSDEEEEGEKRGQGRGRGLETPSSSYNFNGYPPQQEAPSSSYNFNGYPPEQGAPSSSYNFNGYPPEQEAPSSSYNFNGYPQPQGSWGYNDAGYNPYPFQYPNPNQYSYSNPNSNMYYMKKSATPAKTVVYEDPVVNGYSSFYGNGGYFGGYPMMGSPPSEPSPQRPPPAPPSPPRVSAWDFLNVFESYDNGTGTDAYPAIYSGGKRGYASTTTSSPDSKEVREREGIPDLEDETENEVIKEVHREKRKAKEEMNMNGNGKIDEQIHKNYGEGSSKSVPPVQTSSGSMESMKGKEISSASPDTYRSPESILSSKSPGEESVRKKGVSFGVEEASVMDFDSSKASSLTTLSVHGTRDLQEVVKEIKDEFETASSHGKEVASLLEVGRLPYQRRTTLLRVIFSRILYMVSSHPPPRSSVHISSKTMKIAKAYSGDSGDDFDRMPRNLSSTLDEIYAWEKKLYKHVKDEETLRVTYEKECRRLRSLDEHGAETSKIEATQALIRKLLTKLKVSIRAIDAISSKIHMLRDKELQPRVTELVHGMIRMWKSILGCHQKQFRAVMESKICSLRANTGANKDSGLRATLELESELIHWCTCFINWINTQKTYIKSLNGWLLRCLIVEPEETADGTAPFSPGRIGAPPIFVLCNDWYQAMDMISEQAVQNAMLDFASSLHQLWERQDEEQRQRIKAEYLTKDFEKRMRTLRTEKGKLAQEQDALSDKAMSKVPSDSGVSPLDDLKVDLDSMRKKLEEERTRHKEATILVHAAASDSLQAGLAPIFEALGSFTSEVVKGHEQVRVENQT